MITVDDILALPAFETVELAAPCPGAGEREVSNVGILDCPPDYNNYNVYGPRELIVTNLGFAYANPLLAEQSLLAMIKRNVAAIAVKTVYQAPVSEVVRTASTEAGVPVFIYDGAHHERVAYESLDLIQRDRAAADKSRAVDGLLALRGGAAVRSALYELTGATGATLLCVACRPVSRDAGSFYALMNVVDGTLSVVCDDRRLVETVSTCRYGDVILTFISCVSSDEEKRQALEERCSKLLTTVHSLHCGMSDTLWIDNGDVAVRQALAAADAALESGVPVQRWCDMRFAAASQAVRLTGCTRAWWTTVRGSCRLMTRSMARTWWKPGGPSCVPRAMCAKWPSTCSSTRTPFATDCGRPRRSWPWKACRTGCSSAIWDSFFCRSWAILMKRLRPAELSRLLGLAVCGPAPEVSGRP